MFRSNNVAARVFQRQIITPRPGANVNLVRQFYENVVPSCIVYDVDCPDHSFRKFTDGGKYLISFSRNNQDLIVYRLTWLTFSCKGEGCDSHDMPPKAKKFDSFFTQLYGASLASSMRLFAKTSFCTLRATSLAYLQHQLYKAMKHLRLKVRLMESHLLRRLHFTLLEDGVILDEKVFCNDFVNLAHSMGVFLHEDLLCVMSLRYQTIHVLQIRDSGHLVDVRMIGAFCREDDELFLNSQAPVTPGRPFLRGIKQRLLSFIFRKTWNKEEDQTLRVQHLKKKFYFNFQDYVDLIMRKVQFLDRHHLLIKFGSVDGGVSRSTDQHPAFFAVYNMETTEIVAFYQNSAEELYYLFEHFYDHFHATSRNSLHANFISSHSNNIHALDQLCMLKNKASSFSLSQSLSPYFDPLLFRYDEKLISATDRHRHATENPIKFTSRRPPNVVKFKIKPGAEGDTGGQDGRPKRISSFLFHPYLPFALSIQQTFMQPTVVNIHFWR